MKGRKFKDFFHPKNWSRSLTKFTKFCWISILLLFSLAAMDYDKALAEFGFLQHTLMELGFLLFLLAVLHLIFGPLDFVLLDDKSSKLATSTFRLPVLVVAISTMISIGEVAHDRIYPQYHQVADKIYLLNKNLGIHHTKNNQSITATQKLSNLTDSIFQEHGYSSWERAIASRDKLYKYRKRKYRDKRRNRARVLAYARKTKKIEILKKGVPKLITKLEADLADRPHWQAYLETAKAKYQQLVEASGRQPASLEELPSGASQQ